MLRGLIRPLLVVGLLGLTSLATLALWTNQGDQADAPALRSSSAETPMRPVAFLQDRAAPGEHPFPRRTPSPNLDGGVEWLNTGGPLKIEDLKGKFVILDFWTYCCINCIHILPELKKLEHKYPNELVVIGVHSAKFETEKDTENIRAAILRYEIEHPVVNDADMKIWTNFQVNSWPSLRVIDPNGDLVAGHSGETTFEVLDSFLQKALPYYRQRGLLNETPLQWNMERLRERHNEPLLFPGKVLADEVGDRLFIADSTHNRIVIANLAGKLQAVVGNGRVGSDNGSYDQASFNNPQGMWLEGQDLYVADTKNHMIRKIDLSAQRVSTVAGTGTQRRNLLLWPGMTERQFAAGGREGRRWAGPPRRTELSSPWDLLAHDGVLYIAMAGPHQIWSMPLDESNIGPFAGNGREDIIDGKLISPVAFREADDRGVAYSAFAQPSGLATDGQWLFVADSEGSSIRAVPFDPKARVETVIGTSELPGGRLFVFGDRDGTGLLKMRDGTGRFRSGMQDTTGPLLQHPTCVAFADDLIYVADTYNNKIKRIDPKTRKTDTFAGTGKRGLQDEPAQFDEPAGIHAAAGKLYVADTNNHRIRVIDIESGAVSTLVIEGLEPPAAEDPTPLAAVKATQLDAATLRPEDGSVSVDVKLTLPEGYKLNPMAPLRWRAGPEDGEATLTEVVDPAAQEFTIRLPVEGDQGEATWRVQVNYYYCVEGREGLCKFSRAAWVVPVVWSNEGTDRSVTLTHAAE